MTADVIDAAATAALDAVYRERAHLVAFLVRVALTADGADGWDAHWAEPDPGDADNEYPVVCVHAPTGRRRSRFARWTAKIRRARTTQQTQMTWHIKPSDVGLFPQLELRPSDYDGHTTAEKYARLALLPVPQCGWCGIRHWPDDPWYRGCELDHVAGAW